MLTYVITKRYIVPHATNANFTVSKYNFITYSRYNILKYIYKRLLQPINLISTVICTSMIIYTKRL